MPRALLISVGGSPDPVIYSLNEHRPDHVWFLCSEQTLGDASKIYRDLILEFPEWNLVMETIKVDRFEELGPCYQSLRREIPLLLSKHRIQPENVIVDYTGGTKTMSAALVLAAMDHFRSFSYIGGHQREKGGKGVTIAGKERVFFSSNPWAELAVREVERARDLWRAAHFDAAAEVLQIASKQHPQAFLFETIALVARALAERHRLDFASALKTLSEAEKRLPALFDGRNDTGLSHFVEKTKLLCAKCAKKDSSSSVLLDELLDNTLRTASQNRFEDAAARLYRCLEMQLQIWLFETSKGVFKSGRTSTPKEQLEPIYQSCDRIRVHPGFGDIRLGMEDIIHLLHHLGDPRVEALMRDLQLGNNGRVRNAANTRNSGILAHGVEAIGKGGFEDFKSVAQTFFGFDLSRERNPIPELSPLWLQIS